MKHLFPTRRVVVLCTLCVLAQATFVRTTMAQPGPDLTGNSSNPSTTANDLIGPDLTGKGDNRRFLLKDGLKKRQGQRGPDLTGKTTDPNLGKIRTSVNQSEIDSAAQWRWIYILLSVGVVTGGVALVLKNKD